ncbi:MAG: hydrolase [Xanthobacteraceae bacterium]|jgi:hypothetical protein|nr:hydrolase [Xanthobacteraceae bacterium]
MHTNDATDAVDRDRRKVLGAATLGVAAAGIAAILPWRSAAAVTYEDIRPSRVQFPDEMLTDLRRRVAATRWPDKDTVADDSQGGRLATIQKLARYWQTDHDWRKIETRLNARPQSVTEIDGLTIHFIHVRSHQNALPVIVTHGWPGSTLDRFGGRSARAMGALRLSPGRSLPRNELRIAEEIDADHEHGLRK